MTESGTPRLNARSLLAALDGAPLGVTAFDADWTIRYANPAAEKQWRRPVGELLDRSFWVALPELAGTILHSFLLHARSRDGAVTWKGFYPPARRWLEATAFVTDGLLFLHCRDADGAEPDGQGDARDEVSGEEGILGAERLRFLAEVSEALIATLDSGESAARLADFVVPLLGDGAIVTVIGDDGHPRQEAYTHRDRGRLADLGTYLSGRIRGTGDSGPMIDALLSGEPVQLAPIPQAAIVPSLPTDEVRAAWRRLDATSCCIVPLRARGETFGVLTLINSGDRPPHSEMEVATAVEVARRGALALDNAHLYGRQMKLAETLQRSLLTPPVQPDHLEIAVRYRPAAAYQHVGGDWYDAFTQPDGATVLVIGDVVGHDIDAAAAMGQIRSILRGLASDQPDDPARVLGRVDRVLSNLQVGTLATALVARVEQTDEQARIGARTLRWSSAGHLPPLWLRADGKVSVLSTTPERLLGFDADSPRSNHHIEVQPGDSVVLYTDGLVEHGRRAIDDGIADLVDALGNLAESPVEELCDRLLSRFVTGRTDDDTAIVAIRFRPDPTAEVNGPRADGWGRG